MLIPERPASVPPGAIYDAERACWELRSHDERGERAGTWSTFSAEGKLIARNSYLAGKLDGFASRFHDGTAATPLLRNCCVPPGACELRVRFREGRMLEEIFYDEGGRPLSEDGTPWPARAPTIPEHAYWSPGSNTFVEHVDRGETAATLRYFTCEGALVLELDTVSGRKRGQRVYAEGVCVEDTALDDNGKNHGAYVERPRAATSPYLDARIAEVRGRHDHGERCGTWEFCDAAGTRLFGVDYGPAWGDTVSATVLGTDGAASSTADEYFAAAEAHWAAHRPRDAVASAARGLARAGDTEKFSAFLRERAVALSPAAALSYAKAAEEARASPASLLAALLGGAEPSAALVSLATALPSSAAAALDYAEASLRLAPERTASRISRALLYVEHGNPEGALADAAELAAHSQATAQFIRHLVRVGYPRFDFLPATDPVTLPDEELVAVEAAQPLEAVRHAASLLATRLELVRREISLRSGASPEWLPPDVRALLPGGLLELTRRTARIADENEEGVVEVSEVEVDETLPLARSTRALLATARADWAALCWLCWSSGLDHVALPESLEPRPLFAAAAHRSTVRCWLANDRVKSAGLMARARKIQGFTFEDEPIETLPTASAEVALVEYLNLRAMFFWLLYPQNESIFQADLRQV